MNIHISHSNKKMNDIPSFSLPSGETCSKTACKTCYVQGCYARKIEKLRPNVHRTYEENLDAAKNHLGYLEEYLNTYFDSPNAPRIFRIHVAGDFFSEQYYLMWTRVAAKHPETKFLAFTKQYSIILPHLGSIPENFSLVWSAWPGVPVPKSVRACLPVAWMQNGEEKRVPRTAKQCNGNCLSCTSCWAEKEKDVVFLKH